MNRPNGTVTGIVVPSGPWSVIDRLPGVAIDRFERSRITPSAIFAVGPDSAAAGIVTVDVTVPVGVPVAPIGTVAVLTPASSNDQLPRLPLLVPALVID